MYKYINIYSMLFGVLSCAKPHATTCVPRTIYIQSFRRNRAANRHKASGRPCGAPKDSCITQHTARLYTSYMTTAYLSYTHDTGGCIYMFWVYVTHEVIRPNIRCMYCTYLYININVTRVLNPMRFIHQPYRHIRLYSMYTEFYIYSTTRRAQTLLTNCRRRLNAYSRGSWDGIPQSAFSVCIYTCNDVYDGRLSMFWGWTHCYNKAIAKNMHHTQIHSHSCIAGHHIRSVESAGETRWFGGCHWFLVRFFVRIVRCMRTHHCLHIDRRYILYPSAIWLFTLCIFRTLLSCARI